MIATPTAPPVFSPEHDFIRSFVYQDKVRSADEVEFLVHRCMEEKGWDRGYAERAVNYYFAWLVGIKYDPERVKSPWKPIDAVFHLDYLDPLVFDRFCRKFFGHRLLHIPVHPGQTDVPTIQDTLRAMWDLRLPTPPDLWGLTPFGIDQPVGPCSSVAFASCGGVSCFGGDCTQGGPPRIVVMILHWFSRRGWI